MEREQSTHKLREKLIDIGVPLATVGLFVIASLGAFTRKQRDAIVERDDGKCQMPKKHRHKGGLQVHHIIPQRYAKEVGIEDPDYPENGLTVCEEAHVGPNGIHPDIFRAKKNYGKDKQSFSKVFKERGEKLKKKEIYWDDSHDRQMSVVAVRNTQKKKKLGWLFPEKKQKP